MDVGSALNDYFTRARQRLLYLHAINNNLHAEVVAFALHEPREGWISELDPRNPQPPYPSVHAAVVDGWRVIHFPQQRASVPAPPGFVGFEFVLEKWGVPNDHAEH